MKHILFVDDDDSRALRFCAGQRLASVAVRQTAAAAIEALRRETFDEIWLDHDLGKAVGEDEDSPTSGSEIVRRIIAEELVSIATPIIVHSLNGVAALKMIRALREAGYSARYQPFGTQRSAERDQYVDACVSGEAQEFAGLPGIPIIGGAT